MQFSLRVFLALAVIFYLVAVAPARADVTYTYTGNAFASVGGSIGVTSAKHITVTFSLPTPLGPNLNCATVETNGLGLMLSFNMTDGVHSFGLGTNTQVFCVSTSSTGQITQWIVGDFATGVFPFIVSTNIPSAGNENDVVALTALDFARVDNNPGSWSTGSAQAPPNTVLQICLGKNSPGANFCNLGDHEASVHDTSASITDTFGSSDPGAQLTGTAAGAAHFGTLRASSSATFNLSGAPGGHAFSHAISTFDDTVTINFPSFDGSPGILQVIYTLSGSVSSSGAAVGLGFVEGNVNGHPFVNQYEAPVSGIFVAGTFPFIYGQPFRQEFQLVADSGTIVANAGPAGDVCIFCTGSGSASANFLNTFVLSGFEVFDSNGNPLPSTPTITSSSGTLYSENGVLTSFEELSIKEIDLESGEGEFDIKGSFRLGASSNGIDPLNEDLALQIGTFSIAVPSGAFKLEWQGDRDDAERNDRNGLGRYVFEGTINGVGLEIEIRPSTEGKFNFTAVGHRAHITRADGPLRVRLMVGDDGGTTTLMSRGNRHKF